MIRKNRLKNIGRNIGHQIGRFLSILFIVALGAGFMAGLAATSEDMYDTADGYMDEYGWYDLHVKCPIGFSREDIAAVSSLDFVENVQQANVLDLVLQRPDGTTQTGRIYSMDLTGSDGLNRFELTQGRLPENSGECVLQSVLAQYMDNAPAIGEELTVSKDNQGYETILSTVATDKLVVVGYVSSPMCLGVQGDRTTSGDGTVNLHIYTTSAWIPNDEPTDLYLSLSGARVINTFSQAYDDMSLEAEQELKDVGSERVVLQAQAYLQKADKGAEGLQMLGQAVRSVSSLFASAQGDIDLRAEQLALAASALDDGSEKGRRAAELLAKEKTALESMTAEKMLEEADAAAAAMDAEAQKMRTDAQAVKKVSWLVMSRSDSVGFSSYRENVKKVSALAVIFPVFFFAVALLVALTSMTRLVEEKRGEAGILKALGMSHGNILAEYIFFSLSASVLGCVLGFAIGFRLFPSSIASAYGMLYSMPRVVTPVRWNIVAVVAPLTVTSILLATVLACWGTFKSCPAALMIPKAPAPGKRVLLEKVTPVWRRLSFLLKVTFRNLFRYRKRFLMTVIGVAGCTALLLTGFGLRDSIHDIVHKQFDELFHFDLTITLRDGERIATDESLTAYLSDTARFEEFTVLSQSSGSASVKKASGSVNILVPKDVEKFGDFVTLRTYKKNEPLTLTDGGMILTKKLSETLGLSPGDTVTLENADGLTGDAVVTGIAESYLYNCAFLTPDGYRSVFGEDPGYTSVYCICAEGVNGSDEVSTAMAYDSILFASSTSSVGKTFNDNLASINGVIWVLILSAGLLCVVVLYNLISVNIEERRRELATLRVLGFYVRETEWYIFRETNFLSVIGGLVGLVAGVFLHRYVVRTVEIDAVMFGRDIYFPSYLYAIGVTMLFTLAVNFLMRRKIRKTDMVESMKAND
ncbi:MAG: FtsX-like permease family protein [Clostridia bacterium]|nr:FtsX-like permease family protein [Clostridia bacterium]